MVLQEIIYYTHHNGKIPFRKWLSSLNAETRHRIIQRLLRVSQGNFGDYKMLSNGIYELRFSWGVGYRVYFGRDGDKVVVLLQGGDKSTQQSDIKMAIQYWEEYLEDSNDT